jgi:hydroxymethylbilane synthase
VKSKGPIRVGTRRSKLALQQCRSVIASLQSIHPGIGFDLVEIATTGDRHRQNPLDVLGGEGVFVRELEQALTDGRIDMAVHSAKDMPTSLTDGLCLSCVPQRVDPSDVLVSRCGGLADLPPGARVGTGSQRRAVQLRAQRSDLEVLGLRGNIDTRLRKVASGEFDSIVLAAAALIRLEMADRIAEYLPHEAFTPAVGQGALGIEVRESDSDIIDLLSPLNHDETWQCVVAEREFLRALGGGCRAPIAANGTVSEGSMYLQGMVADPDGKTILRASCDREVPCGEEVGNELAMRMLDMGANLLVERMWQ